jgi:putative heme-binding domain-containing protein
MLVILPRAAPAQAPIDDSPAAVEEGLRIYRSKCARCHDLNAQGYKGADLTQLSNRNLTNAQIANIIVRGIPGTDMPAQNLDTIQQARVIAYLRSLNGPAVVDRGDAKRGEALFWGKAQCGQCHMIRGRGGRIGQDLTRIGAARSKAFLVRELRNPTDYVPKGYDAVKLTTQSGEEVVGIRRNEDTFSIQIMDIKENLRSFLKSELRDLSTPAESLMPAYGPDRLNDMEFNDLLKYLAGLR